MKASRWLPFVREFDWVLFGAVGLTMALGLTVLYSIAVGRESGDFLLFRKQLIVALVGVALLFAVASVDYQTWQAAAPYLYLGVATLLGLVLAVGQTRHATRGWLALGSFQLQPVELAKVATVIALAAYLARRAREVRRRLSNVLQSFLLVAVLVVLVLLQPDFGSAAILGSVWAAAVLIVGIRRRDVLLLSALLLGGLLGGWFFLFKPYQQERLLTFFRPSARTAAQTYNVRQAIIAVGSGGVLGRGLGQGPQSQLRFLPEAETDFIFAVIGEELGFVGLVLLLGLYGGLGYRLLVLLFRCRDDFASFVVLGTLLLFGVEVAMNAGMNMGLFPVVGIPLPLVSAGGSSLVAHCLLLGVVESVARRERSSGYRLSHVAVA